MRILVTGDRHGFDDKRLRETLDDLLEKSEEDVVIIEGEAPGVDTQAKFWAFERHVECVPFTASWSTYGRRAGPIRNHQMLKEGQLDLVVAFHHDLGKSKGTANMINIAQKAGIATLIVS